LAPKSELTVADFRALCILRVASQTQTRAPTQVT
jgi:hypothetical protein